jgi:cobalt-zinc-cadmium efflux system protein
VSGHDHDHGAAARRAGARHVRPLALALLLTIGFLAVRIATGIVTGSLALLSDAAGSTGHRNAAAKISAGVR